MTTALRERELERWTGVTRRGAAAPHKGRGARAVDPPTPLASARAAVAGRIPMRVAKRDVWHGAEVSRLTNDWVAGLMNSDDEVRWSLTRMRARGRELARNNPYAKQFLNLLAVNVIGPTGIRLQAKVKNNDGKPAALINSRIEAGWKSFSKRVSTDGRHSMTRFSMQLLRTVAKDGEVFVRKWRGYAGNRWGLALEAIDADQVDHQFNQQAKDGQNEVRMGIEVDPHGKPVAYHVWNKPLSTSGFTGQRMRERIPAHEIIHLYDPERVNQTRGVTWFHAVMYALRMIALYAESELVGSRIGASKMGFFQRKSQTELGDLEAELPEGEGEAGHRHLDMEANPGTFEFVPDGYELTPWTPDHPSTAFSDFMKGELRGAASGLGISYNELANDLENVNFSSMRSGILTARDMWRALQEWWINAFLQDVYMEWVNWSLLTEQLRLDSRDPLKFEDVHWLPRGWPWVDPKKDVEAAVLAIQHGLGSRRKFVGEQGDDWDEIVEELAEERAVLQEHGLAAPAADPLAAEDDEDEDDGDEPKRQRNGHVNGHAIRPALRRALRGNTG